MVVLTRRQSSNNVTTNPIKSINRPRKVTIPKSPQLLTSRKREKENNPTVNSLPLDISSGRLIETHLREEIQMLLATHQIDAAKDNLLRLVSMTNHWADIWKLADTLIRSDNKAGMISALKLITPELSMYPPLQVILLKCLRILPKESRLNWTDEEVRHLPEMSSYTCTLWPDIPNREACLAAITKNDTPLDPLAKIYFEHNYQACISSCDPILLLSFPLKLAIHTAALRHLGDTENLFKIAQMMVNTLPDYDLTWFVVGLYYSLTGKHLDARRFLRRAAFGEEQERPTMIADFLQRFFTVQLIEALCCGGDHDQCLVLLRLLCRTSTPEEPYYKLLQAREHLHLRRMHLAIKYFDPKVVPSRYIPLYYTVLAEYALYNHDSTQAAALLSQPFSFPVKLGLGLELLCGVSSVNDLLKVTDRETLRQVCAQYMLPMLTEINATNILDSNENEEASVLGDVDMELDSEP